MGKGLLRKSNLLQMFSNLALGLELSLTSLVILAAFMKSCICFKIPVPHLVSRICFGMLTEILLSWCDGREVANIISSLHGPRWEMDGRGSVFLLFGAKL